MSKIKTLTESLAKQFLADENSVVLHEYTRLEDQAAKALVGCKRPLYLDGLTHLSEDSAESLAQHNGLNSFFGLRKLSGRAAELTAGHVPTILNWHPFVEELKGRKNALSPTKVFDNHQTVNGMASLLICAEDTPDRQLLKAGALDYGLKSLAVVEKYLDKVELNEFPITKFGHNPVWWTPQEGRARVHG